MSALGIAVVAVVVVIACSAAVLADRLLDAAVGGSYSIAQKAWRRRGRRLFWIALVAAVVLAVALTIVGILANGS